MLYTIRLWKIWKYYSCSNVRWTNNISKSEIVSLMKFGEIRIIIITVNATLIVGLINSMRISVDMKHIQNISHNNCYKHLIHICFCLLCRYSKPNTNEYCKTYRVHPTASSVDYFTCSFHIIWQGNWFRWIRK